MKGVLRILMLCIIVAFNLIKVCSQVNTAYGLALTSGAYTPITGGTVIVTGTTSLDSYVSGALTIPSITFMGTSYTTAYVTSNGLLTLGSTAPSSTLYTGISTTSSPNPKFCPFNADLDRVNSTAATEIRWEDVGTEVVFQWTAFKRYSVTESFNLQVRINKTTGEVKFVYGGAIGTPGSGTSYQPQVGIRGSSTASDFQNISVASGSETWAAPLITGNSSSATCRYTSTSPAKSPSAGQTYTWTACAPPSAVSGTGTSGTTATINWTAGAGTTNYDIYYSTSSTAPTYYTVPSANDVTGTSSTVSGLTSGTTYYLWMRSDCGGVGPWIAASPTTFSTLTTTPPNCPVTITTPANAATGVSLTASLTWTAATGAPTGYKLNMGSNAPNYDNLFNLQDIGNVLTYAPAGMTGGTTYGWKITPYNANGDASGCTFNTFTTICPAPTALVTSNIATTSFTLDWTQTGGHTAWDLFISTSSTTPSNSLTCPTTGLVCNNTSKPYSFSGLAQGATYYIWVRPTCSGGSTNPWSVSASATLLCDAISTLLWTENFDALTTLGSNNFPPCWFKENGEWTSGNAASQTYNDPRSAPNYVYDAWSATNEFLWTPGFSLIAGTTYEFSFYFAGDTYTGWTGDVFYNTSQVSTGATQLGSSFITSGTTSTPTYARVANTFTPSSSGNYYFAIRINANGTPYYLGFDDFKLQVCTGAIYGSSSTVAPSSASVAAGSVNNQIRKVTLVLDGCGSGTQDVTQLDFSNTSTNTADVASAKVYYTGTTNTFSTATQFGSTVAAPGATFSVSGTTLSLAAGTYFFWLVYDAACGATPANVMRGECTSITVNATPQTPTAGAATSRALTGFTTSTVQPLNTSVSAGAVNAQVLRVDVSGAAACGNVTQINLATTGTTNVGDILKARVYYTTNATFATTNQFGSEVTSPTGAFSVTGTQTLVDGATNYFWVVYDISCSATTGNLIDAECTSVVYASHVDSFDYESTRNACTHGPCFI